MFKPVYAVFGFLLFAVAIGLVTLLAIQPSSTDFIGDSEKSLKQRAEIGALAQTAQQQSVKIEFTSKAILNEAFVNALNGATKAQESIAGAIRQQNQVINDLRDTIRNQYSENIRRSIVVASQSRPKCGIFYDLLIIVVLFAIFPCSFIVGDIFYERWAEDLTTKKKLIARSATSLLTIGSLSIGSIVTVKELTLLHIDRLELNTRAPGEESTQIQDISVSIQSPGDRAVSFDCGGADPKTANDMRIGPFPIGMASRQDNVSHNPEINHEFDVRDASFDAVTQRIKGFLATRNLLGLILIGSFDKRTLKPDLKEKYGENAGLAMARAEWVKRKLFEILGSKGNVVTMVSGPRNAEITPIGRSLLIEQKNSASLGADDRTVQVCAMWEINRSSGAYRP